MLFYRMALSCLSLPFLLLPFPTIYIQAWLRRYDRDLSYVTHNWAQRYTPNISLFWPFERVIHCPLILDFFSCIYTGSTVNGEFSWTYAARPLVLARQMNPFFLTSWCVFAYRKPTRVVHLLFASLLATVSHHCIICIVISSSSCQVLLATDLHFSSSASSRMLGSVVYTVVVSSAFVSGRGGNLRVEK
jgi:hypothetical protein